MNQQSINTTENGQIETENDFFQFADLNLQDEELDNLKGGPMFYTWCTTIGNHNETTVTDDSDGTGEDLFQFADLNLQDEELDNLKGGPMFCTWCTTIGNHNETTVEDSASELNDLTVSDDSAIVGGPLKRIRIGGMSFGEEGAE